MSNKPWYQMFDDVVICPSRDVLREIQGQTEWTLTELGENPEAMDIPGAMKFRAILEHKETRRAIHAPGQSLEAAIAEAWRLAGIIEGASRPVGYGPGCAADRVAQMGRDD